MKKLVILILLGFVTKSFSQDLQNDQMFSRFNFSILGGTNFNTVPTVGGSLQFEGKTNLTSSINLKVSVGFSSMFEEKDYLIKSYSHFIIDNIEGYQLNTYSINQIQYSVIPINLGIEYTLVGSEVSPFGVFEMGYNFYNGEEQVLKSGSGEYFDNIDEVPSEYLNAAPGTFDGSSFGIGLGLGLKYQISSSFDLNIRYMYRYNNSLINTNQILFGITF